MDFGGGLIKKTEDPRMPIANSIIHKDVNPPFTSQDQSMIYPPADGRPLFFAGLYERSCFSLTNDSMKETRAGSSVPRIKMEI